MKKNYTCGHCGEKLHESDKNRIECKACGYVNYYHSDSNSFKAYGKPNNHGSGGMTFI